MLGIQGGWWKYKSHELVYLPDAFLYLDKGREFIAPVVSETPTSVTEVVDPDRTARETNSDEFGYRGLYNGEALHLSRDRGASFVLFKVKIPDDTPPGKYALRIDLVDADTGFPVGDGFGHSIQVEQQVS